MAAVALLGATIVDVDAGICRQDQVLVIEDGRIAAVGPQGATAIPADAQRVNVAGRFITPGLIDMHCHLTMYDDVPLEMFLANGVTTVRDPGGRVAKQRLLRETVESGTRLGPRIVISGEILDGNPPVWSDDSIIVDSPDRAIAAVRHLAAQGADCIKVYNHVTEDVLMAIVAAAREAGLPVIGHVPRQLSMRRAVEIGMNGLEHIRITGGDFLPPDQAAALDPLPLPQREPRLWARIELDAPWVAEIIAELALRRVTLDPTLIVDEVGFSEEVGAEISHRDNRYLPPSTYERWAAEEQWTIDHVPSFMRVPESLRAAAADMHAKRREFVRRCAEAGVRVVAGTDGAGCGRLLPGFALHHELELLRACGLSPFATLRAATVDAAQALGLGDEIGTVAPGKAADLAVWKADPLLTHLQPSDLDTVWAQGSPHRPSELLQADVAP